MALFAWSVNRAAENHQHFYCDDHTSASVRRNKLVSAKRTSIRGVRKVAMAITLSLGSFFSFFFSPSFLAGAMMLRVCYALWMTLSAVCWLKEEQSPKSAPCNSRHPLSTCNQPTRTITNHMWRMRCPRSFRSAPRPLRACAASHSNTLLTAYRQSQ